MKLISRKKSTKRSLLLNEKVLNDIVTLAENLRAIRSILRLSCEDLAGYLGTTKQTISNIELYESINICQYISIRKILDILFEDLGYDSSKVKACLQLMNEDINNYIPDKWMRDYYKCVSNK